MSVFQSKITKTLLVGFTSIPLTIISFLVTLYVHLKIYAYLNPDQTTEIDHNYFLESQVNIHTWVAIPVIYIFCCAIIWHLTAKRGKNA